MNVVVGLFLLKSFTLNLGRQIECFLNLLDCLSLVKTPMGSAWGKKNLVR